MPNLIARRTSSLEPLEARIAPATFTVSNTNDDMNDGSLRKAIADAEASAGADTIIFTVAADSKITLTMGELAITESLYIKGPGAGKLTISGNDASRIFNIDDSDSNTHQNVRISGLTLTAGFNAANGGAIIDKESLTIENSVIHDNASSGSGGGLHVSTSGKFLMKNTKVTGNTASGNGGGLYVSTGEGTLITGSTLSGNSAGSSGGAFYGRITGAATSKSTLVIDKTTISGNTATSSGGGLTLRNNIVGTDTMDQTADDGLVILRNSVVSGNNVTDATAKGGGVYLAEGNIQILGTSIINNRAVISGGGVTAFFGVDSLTVKGSKFSGNSTTDAAGDGGAGLNISGTFKSIIQSSTFTANKSASDGGAIFTEGGATVNLIASTFSNNEAVGDDGGAIYVDGTTAVTLDVKSSKFYDNRAANDGGAISTTGTGNFTILSSLFTGNFAGDDGGAIDTTGGTKIAIKSTKLLSNVATGEGGAMYLRSSDTIDITSSVISQNVAKTSNGGGLSLGQSGAKNFKSVTITNNTSASTGGGISVFGTGKLTVTSSKITGNVADARGGGIANYAGAANLEIISSKIIDNSAPSDPQVKAS